MTHGLWEASAPPAPPAQPLAEGVEADVAIIGCGFTGASAALHLASGGASVVVLEAQEIGFGASGRNVGLVNAGMWVMPSVLLNELGPVMGPRLLDLLGNGPSAVFELVEKHRIECEALHNGTLHCAVGRAGVQEVHERARQWKERGAPVEVLDAERTAQFTGTRAYGAALLDHRAGTVQPLAYVRGLSAAALHAGARIHTRTPVVAAQRIGDSWQLSTRSGATVRAKWVIVATDAYTGAQGLWPGIRNEQVFLPYFNLATAPLPPDLAVTILPQRQGAWDTRQVLSSFRFDAAGRFIFGSVGALRGAGRAIHPGWARRAMAKLFPQLRGVPFEHEWYGTIGMTSDALPRFHELDRNVVSFSGFNGRGIAPGTVLGRELARLVLGEVRREDLPLPATPVAPAPLRTARTLGYELGAQAFHLVDARL
ncbi:NAD(P)/FAD-dependent oxidoreductase [Ramlibacter albus]|uniref:NAD(P)/FAD-dependent oxidoreductase n=1 Tax=Ramlibacter albus TaxID=2079448 RepID=UPI002107E9B6|nr:FAD-binding oxidoreductase [Ramlibacter albus]